MNIYIGNSLKEVEPYMDGDYDVYIPAELFEHIAKLYDRGRLPFDMGVLFRIDPYDDVVIPKEDLPKIIEIFEYIIDNSLIYGYKRSREDSEKGIEILQSFIKMAKEALSKNKGLFSSGD